MAMQFTPNNIFLFVSYIMPFVLTFFFILAGFMDNKPLASIIFTSLILLVTAITSGLQHVFKMYAPIDKSPFCDLFEIPFIGSEYGVPSVQITTIMFMIVYTLLPMFMNHNVNYSILTLLLGVLVLVLVSKYFNKCTNLLGMAVSVVLGGALGTGLSLAIQSTSPDLLYFGPKRSNNVQCGMPNKQTFKCNVYKNGKLIKSL